MSTNEYQVVELEGPITDTEWDEETSSAVAALESNVGFLALCGKLKVQRGLLDTMLRKKRHEDIRSVDTLQSGIYWSGWLEKTVEAEVLKHTRRTTKPRVAYDLEETQFKKMREALQLVGIKPDTNIQ